MTAWSLVTCRPAKSSRTVVATVTSDGTVREVPFLDGHRELVSVLDSWDTLAAQLHDWDPADGVTMDGAGILAPLRYPRKLICAGANYGDHLREMGIAEIPPDMEPFFFLLPPTTIVGPHDAIAIPDDPQARVDWEAELAVVIGRPARHVTPETALDHVAGYSIVNDISARGWHARLNPLAPPFGYDWLGSKGSDTFTPMGPGLTPSWFVPDPQDLRIRLWRNGVLKQDGSTSGMIFTVAQLVAAASVLMTLEPGDVIATGTPAGVGVARQESLVPGDVLTVEIQPLGRLENPVTSAVTPARTPVTVVRAR